MPRSSPRLTLIPIAPAPVLFLLLLLLLFIPFLILIFILILIPPAQRAPPVIVLACS